MQSSPTSEQSARLLRAITDPYAAAIAVLVGLVVLAVRWPVVVVALAVVLVLGVRIAAEFIVPRGAQLELADSLSVRQEQIRAALARVEVLARQSAPPQVTAKVGTISGTIRDITERQTTLAASSPQLFSVLRTATDYLPSAILAYIRLPRGYAATRQLSDGRTPLDVLIGQLDLLEREMIDVADAVTQNDLNRLLAHERFLNERFGRSALTLPDTARQ